MNCMLNTLHSSVTYKQVYYLVTVHYPFFVILDKYRF